MKNYICGRCFFKGSTLTASVNITAGYSLIETIEKLRGYFTDKYPTSKIDKIQLFLSESDMHSEKEPFQTTYFNQNQQA